MPRGDQDFSLPSCAAEPFLAHIFQAPCLDRAGACLAAWMAKESLSEIHGSHST